LADEIAHLCMTRFLDADSGGVREFFESDWSPLRGDMGRILEPGHLFEWAWLLARWAERRGNTFALAKAERLFNIGESYGICAEREVAIMALHDDFTARDEMARLWPQAEWLKSAMRLAILSCGKARSDYLASALRAMAALRLFLGTSVSGLWRDKLKPDGRFVFEPAPASSLYHIAGAIYEVEQCLLSLEAVSHDVLP
ncbi:MAG TPA: AGE family epimerase/isomerase, partial [Rhizobium sp.]|nr:AGE family epimerase/isomerase [Rhizobium sp.]